MIIMWTCPEYTSVASFCFNCCTMMIKQRSYVVWLGSGEDGWLAMASIRKKSSPWHNNGSLLLRLTQSRISELTPSLYFAPIEIKYTGHKHLLVCNTSILPLCNEKYLRCKFEGSFHYLFSIYFLGGSWMVQKSVPNMDLTTAFLEATSESAIWTKTKMLEHISASPPTLLGPLSAERPV